MQVVRGTSAGARVFEIIKLQPSIPIAARARCVRRRSARQGGVRLASVDGAIAFDHLHFRYATRPDQASQRDHSRH